MKYQEHGERKRITNEEKLRETFPDTIFTFWRDSDDLFAGIRLSDGWLQADYDQMHNDSEPCEDAVSREAVDELSKALVHTTRDKADFLCNFWEGLQKLPPLTPKPKTGKQELNNHQGIQAVGFLTYHSCLRQI